MPRRLCIDAWHRTAKIRPCIHSAAPHSSQIFIRCSRTCQGLANVKFLAQFVSEIADGSESGSQSPRS